MLLLKLAFLNIWRNPRRSIITVLAVAVGLAALIFLWGFSDGTTEQQRQNVIRLFTGHVQLHAREFEKKLSPELTIPDKKKALQAIQSNPWVVAVTERVKSEALLGTTENSRGVLLIGIDPEKESKVTDLKVHLSQGAFLASADGKEILVGDSLAEKIHVGLGDKIVVLTQAADGTMAGYAYHVKGIFHTGSDQVDQFSAYVTIASERELLGIGEESHEVVIRLKDRFSIPEFLSGMKTQMDPARYQFSTWTEIIPQVEQWVLWAEAVIKTIMLTVMIVIGVGIMNTVLMSVFERTRELGVMMAIGTSPAQLMKLIVLESLVLEMIGIVFGVIGGYLIVLYFSKAGIHFRGVEEAFAATFMSTVVYTQVQIGHVIQSIITLVLMTSFIGLYPAWKAGRMEPVKAIYHSY